MSDSQFGQSEWLLEFLAACGIREGVVFEAGASGPQNINNSSVFLKNGFRALLCEADKNRCEEWNETGIGCFSIINKQIDYGRKGLEQILDELQAPFSLEVLFFDIDGGEYQLLEGMDSYRPKLICVEYDNAYPLNIDYIPLRTRHEQQASSLAMFKLMRSKGYKYLKSFSHDHIFVSDEFVNQYHDSIEHKGIEYGDDLFFNESPGHLYQLNLVCANQADGAGAAGINFYDSKLKNLIHNEYLVDAKNFYCHLCASFDAMTPFVKLRGDSYSSQYISALEKFRSSYLWLVRC